VREADVVIRKPFSATPHRPPSRIATPGGIRPRRKRHGRTDPAIRSVSDLCPLQRPNVDPRQTACSGRAAPSADRSELADTGDAVVGQEPSSPIAGRPTGYPPSPAVRLGTQRRARIEVSSTTPGTLSSSRAEHQPPEWPSCPLAHRPIPGTQRRTWIVSFDRSNQSTDRTRLALAGTE
jgi:hypothetical protein